MDVPALKPKLSKRLQRIQKKYNKISAYLEIVKMNDQDGRRARDDYGNEEEENEDEDTTVSCDELPRKHKQEVKLGKRKKIKVDTEDCEISVEVSNLGISTSDRNSDNIFQQFPRRGTETENTSLVRNTSLFTVSNKYKTQHITNFFARDVGLQASFLKPETSRIPLLMADIQHLLILSQMGAHSPFMPRWCYMETLCLVSHAVVLVVDGVSSYDFQANESKIPFLHNQFSTCKLEVIVPSQYNTKFPKELALLPVISSDAGKLLKRHGNLKLALQEAEHNTKVLHSFFSIDPMPIQREISECKIKDKFPRTSLLLSGWQLLDEKFPVPFKGLKNYASFVFTKDRYAAVTNSSPMFSLDCEMCQTNKEDKELTRISVVNEKLECVYETLVKPYNPIINYLTRYSGITKKLLENVKTRLEDVQKALRELLPPDAILVGHSINFDLLVLKMVHPYIIDTSVIYNLSGLYRHKVKLALLSKMYLGEDIQNSAKGHCPREDSIAAMKLVQLKLSQSLSYGNAAISDSRSKENTSLRDFINTQGTSAIYGTRKNVKRYRRYIRRIVSSPDVSQDASSPSHEDTDDCARTEDNGISRVGFFPHDSCDKAVTKASQMIGMNQLTICHVSVDSEQGSETVMCKVNEWSKQVWDSSPANTLCTIILSGSQNTNVSGAALISVKS